MEFIINMVPFSSVHEEDRLREILEKIIEEEDLPRFKAFTNEPPSKKKKRLAKVSIQCIQLTGKKIGSSDFSSFSISTCNVAL